MTYSFCEPVWAMPLHRVHVREHAEGDRRVGGGIDTPTLCGRMMNYGWDLEHDVTREALDTRPDHVCDRCAQAWLERQPGYVAPPPPKIQGMRSPHLVVIDEAGDFGGHVLQGPDHRPTCSCGEWQAALGESIHRGFDRHLLSQRQPDLDVGF